MKVNSKFEGQKKPFEGDRTFHLKTLPAGARVTSARVRLMPQKCVETITFDENGAGNWGATKQFVEGSSTVSVDFHARRMVNQFVTVANTDDTTTVQVDIGGLWMPMANDGTIVASGDAKELKLAAATIHHIPQMLVQRIQLTDTNGSGPPDLQSVTIVSLPSNLTLRLGEGLPFWARPGELAAEESSPDFAEILQAFLAGAEVKNGYYDLPLVVHTDTIACLDLEVEIEFVKEQTVLPESVGETTLSFTHNGLPEAEADLLQIEVPAGARIDAEKTTALVTGAFQPSRIVHGPTGAVAEPAAIPVTSVQSQAQPIGLEKTLAATGVDLRLSLDPDSATATLSLNILADSDGKPANEPLLPEPATISLDRDTAGTPTWISTDLPSEFQFDEGERYWLVLQAADGSVLWSADEAGKDEDGKEVVGMHFTDNGGLSWRLTSSPDLTGAAAGLFRLRYTPDRFQMPIEIQVGSGDQEARVSLDRFQPLGRVEFDLGFDEVADTINRFLEKESAATCPAVEHLANGDFDKWTTTTGYSIPQQNPQEIDLPPQPLPLALAIAPDGCRAFTVQLQPAQGESSPVVRFLSIDIPGHYVGDAIELLTLSNDAENILTSVTLNDDGTRAFVLIYDVSFRGPGVGSSVISRLFVVDTATNVNLGFFPLPDAPLNDFLTVILLSGMVVTAGGDRLYMLSLSGQDLEVEALDTEKLEGAILSQDTSATLETISIDGLDPIEIPADSWPTGLAISPDGAHLYVTAVISEGLAEGTLHVYDIETHQAVKESPIPIGGVPFYISPSPAGQWLLVSDNASGTVSVIDARRLAVVRTIQLPAPNVEFRFRPGATVFAPDGCLAFVASLASSSIAIIDPNRSAFVNVINTENESNLIANLAITPGGDRLYALIFDFENSTTRLVNWFLGLQLPDEWLVTSGSVIRNCYLDPFHLAAILGLTPVTCELDSRQSSLSQVVPVVGSCTYDFSFWGKATAPGASAELLWLGEACGLLRVDQVPIEEVEGEPESAEQIPIEIALHRRRLIAPEGATQAEIRFITPAGIVAAIDKVSLLGTRELILNNDLQEDQEGQLAGWSQSPVSGAGLISTVAEKGVKLQNLSIDPAALIQTITVQAGQPFNLSFHGRLANQPDATDAARLEVNWLAGDGAAVGSNMTLEIPEDGPDSQAATGTVPAGASEAEIQLIIPGEASLTVEEISFKPVELIQVPLTFVAQAPGELKVSDIRVAFDEAGPTLPAIPKSGLCTPTAAGRPPGEADDCCYCPCCGGDNPLLDPQPTTTPAGRPAVGGDCPNCGARLVQPGGQVSKARIATRPVISRRLASRVSRSPARPPAALLRVATQPPPAMAVEDLLAAVLSMTPVNLGALNRSPSDASLPRLTAIDGIGPARDMHLATIGIEDMRMLAEADPDEVAEVLQGVTATTAATMIAEAQELMAMFQDEQLRRVK